MTPLLRTYVALALALCLAGCVILPSTAPTAVVTPHRAKVIPSDRVKDAVVIGKSTKADVIASLGETLAIGFDTGYEVWVYRLASDVPAKPTLAERIARIGSQRAERATSEFVILFAPSGLVAKTRIRADQGGNSGA